MCCNCVLSFVYSVYSKYTDRKVIVSSGKNPKRLKSDKLSIKLTKSIQILSVFNGA